MTTTTIQAQQRILVALDVPDLAAALALVHALRDHVGGFKVGLELCSAVGVPQVVEAISAAGGRVFLDLKFKDIPNTVAGAVRAIATTCGTGVSMLTLHCDGGSAMLQAAVETLHTLYQGREAERPRLIGVTVLTSLDDATLTRELGVHEPVRGCVVRLARLAQAAGLDGVVASPHEVGAIKQACGESFLAVAPGVRPTWATSGDQRRVMTPAEACHAGADYLVIGRPITAAPPEQGGPAAAAQRIVQDLMPLTKGTIDE
jgi:orotidine-5'-phosphate decarboxylase